jgi:hypothetical protein
MIYNAQFAAFVLVGAGLCVALLRAGLRGGWWE